MWYFFGDLDDSILSEFHAVLLRSGQLQSPMVVLLFHSIRWEAEKKFGTLGVCGSTSYCLLGPKCWGSCYSHETEVLFFISIKFFFIIWVVLGKRSKQAVIIVLEPWPWGHLFSLKSSVWGLRFLHHGVKNVLTIQGLGFYFWLLWIGITMPSTGHMLVSLPCRLTIQPNTHTQTWSCQSFSARNNYYSAPRNSCPCSQGT